MRLGDAEAVFVDRQKRVVAGDTCDLVIVRETDHSVAARDVRGAHLGRRLHAGGDAIPRPGMRVKIRALPEWSGAGIRVVECVARERCGGVKEIHRHHHIRQQQHGERDDAQSPGGEDACLAQKTNQTVVRKRVGGKGILRAIRCAHCVRDGDDIR